MILSGRENSKEKGGDTGAKGYTIKGSNKAKITNTAGRNPYPYHLIHCDKSSNVYGWGTFG
jgi:hypothetical protein